VCRAKATVISQSDKFDKLKKLKELLNDGTLTQEEYDAEKSSKNKNNCNLYSIFV
jgi:hypothetical protein